MARPFLLVVFYLLLLGRLTRSEWVEIPQFSDYHKLYRPPIVVHNQQLQPPQHESDRRVYESVVTVAEPDYLGHDNRFYKETALHNISGFFGNRRPNFPENKPSIMESISTFTTERIVSGIIEENVESTQVQSDEGVEVESSDDNEEKISPQFDESSVMDDSNEDITTTSNPKDTATNESSFESDKTSQYANDTDNDKGFLDYLPIDLFKRVHKTLKSQPPTLIGKIRFLKAFERTLVDEIESRLTTALAPIRVPRGARGHDDHDDDGIGFPSLEGTLMAISFLTFAVYLVRLVMMLFRNAANGTTTPIIIGRKRRSVDEFDEEATRILSYLDSSFPRHY